MNKKKILAILLIMLIVIGIIVYALAKRYLISDVEIDLNQLEPSQVEVGTNNNVVNNDDNNVATYDDWNYEDENINIQIEQHEVGTGEDMITYFVADVQLQDQSYLRTALANNQFGRNIIDYTSSIAEDNHAILAINGDYYGFRDDGIVIRNGQLLRDDSTRDGLVMYSSGVMAAFDEELTSGEQLLADDAAQTFSFGPVLVENSVAYDDFDKVSIDKNFGNRSIQNANPRTGIGWIDKNHYILVVVDGRKSGYSRGMTLNEFAELFEELGAQVAYNLDGGGSSTMYFMGNIVNNPLGKNKEREVSDIIYIGYE
ncbi:phosphodiester glycosidase family protein [Paenibacillus endoradicis]|uniref:phosphodiester glycosidase family protein n=1 Tax=Paenibacillus endoradicis TaxID=2972487 RepID=UPI00215925DA|nr:phosphodiester glycosidase family protein [Paenibacillus endoradicis]MCR8660379.1 phosphodiester glycosidase family protein [Paenibacillus endoradicis]